MKIYILADDFLMFGFQQQLFRVCSTIYSALRSPFIPAGLAGRQSRRGREGLETAAAGCGVTMAAMDFSSLLSIALLYLFKFAAVVSLEKK